MKKYTPEKVIAEQLSTHFHSIEEMEKFLKENPEYENAGMQLASERTTGVGVTLNLKKNIIRFGSEFERFEFMQTNKEFEVLEMLLYKNRPAVWVK